MDTQVGTFAGVGVLVADGGGSVGLGRGTANIENEDEALPGTGVGGGVGGAHGFSKRCEGGAGAVAVIVSAHASAIAVAATEDHADGFTAIPLHGVEYRALRVRVAFVECSLEIGSIVEAHRAQLERLRRPNDVERDRLPLLRLNPPQERDT